MVPLEVAHEPLAQRLVVAADLAKRAIVVTSVARQSAASRAPLLQPVHLPHWAPKLLDTDLLRRLSVEDYEWVSDFASLLKCLLACLQFKANASGALAQ